MTQKKQSAGEILDKHEEIATEKYKPNWYFIRFQCGALAVIVKEFNHLVSCFQQPFTFLQDFLAEFPQQDEHSQELLGQLFVALCEVYDSFPEEVVADILYRLRLGKSQAYNDFKRATKQLQLTTETKIVTYSMKDVVTKHGEAATGEEVERQLFRHTKRPQDRRVDTSLAARFVLMEPEGDDPSVVTELMDDQDKFAINACDTVRQLFAEARASASGDRFKNAVDKLMEVLSPVPSEDSGDYICPADRKAMLNLAKKLVAWVGYKYWVDTGRSKKVWFRSIPLVDDGGGGEVRGFVETTVKRELGSQLAKLQLKMQDFLTRRKDLEDNPDAEDAPDSEVEAIIRDVLTVQDRVGSYLGELGAMASDLKQGIIQVKDQYRKVLNLPEDCPVGDEIE